MLTKVRMWKTDLNTSGFEVTYEAYPPSEFSDWPPETHIFGLTYKTLDEITFDSELTEIHICVDSHASPYYSDFEGFKFRELDGDF